MKKNVKKITLSSNNKKGNDNYIDSNTMNKSFCYTNKNNNLNENYFLKRIIQEYKNEIKNINECLKFNEENYEEEIKVIRGQMTNYLNENIILKTTNDKLLLENNYKEKEIEKYKRIIQDYQKLLLSNNEKESCLKNNYEEKNYNNSNNELLLESKLEKLKTDNLLIINDLKKEQSEHNNTKITLNHYKENIIIYEKKITKKNMKILNLKKQIKELKKSLNNISIKFNLQNNNDSSIISGSFSTPSRINFNNDNNSNIFSNFSFNSKNTNNTVNDNFIKHMNKLLGENSFLRKELQKTKNRLYDSNVQIQIYEAQEEENFKLKQMLQNMNDYINNIINQKIVLINYINNQINELNENNECNNKDINMKFDLINSFNNNYNNINNFTLIDLSIFFKYIFNKIISLCYNIDIIKNKEHYYKKEIKDNEIEKKILQDQIFEKECDIEAYKETIKSYENTIKKLKSENKNLNEILNNYKYKNNIIHPKKSNVKNDLYKKK